MKYPLRYSTFVVIVLFIAPPKLLPTKHTEFQWIECKIILPVTRYRSCVL